MKKITLMLSIALLCSALSGCVVVPARPVAYYPTPVYYAAGGCYHCWR